MTTHTAIDLERATRLFHALSDERRLRILDLLRGGEQCVCDMTEVLDAGQSLLSFHLKALREAGLVTDRRQGRWSYYSLVPEAFEEMEEILTTLREPRGRAAAGDEGCCDAASCCG